jgi:hypothetical protein
MKQHWISSSVVVGALLLAAPAILFARDPKTPNPCRDMKADLDNQVNSLHKNQDNDLAQCRQTNGKNADVCRDLKKQQQLELNQMRGYRQSELSNCGPHANLGATRSQRNSSSDNPGYQNNVYQNDASLSAQ